ncbi:multicopper oxidase family protein [Cryobacterium psychrophilum]|uniref:Copper oxidase n=1 Tax=Cryobacterium psychrophilum TaxID=41988 RepID=A0A4Y8KMS3_9MICO|nr:multicopper oxidase domain-containing protein [Cryobacterium psychrophilum]TDW31319.1 cell division protein SufI [Cryobacterium psychrophilum]TFD78401.1 copper oxidase [Cryobacterium psychrophilum]
MNVLTSTPQRSSGARHPLATRLTVALAALAALTIALAGCSGDRGAGVINTVGTVDFSNPLLIPPLAPSTVAADGTRSFDLTAQADTTQFTPGVDTETWGYDQGFLGPTLVMDRGEHVQMNVTNTLAEATTVHWHGMRLPARMDGGPHQLLAPDASWHPDWTIDQPASTLWYHPHVSGQTEHQVEMGLAGMIILHDDAERALDLPSTYGVDDIPVMVQDRRFDENGQMVTDVRGFIGPLGDQMLVNGTVDPFLDVTTDVVRLRLLNASASRVYNFAFNDERSFDLIGTDGGLLRSPAPMTGIRLSPGERAEVLVRMVPGETVTLRSTPPDLGLKPTVSEQNAGADTLDVLELRAAGTLTAEAVTPSSLVPMQKLSASDASQKRSFVLNGYNINNKLMDMGRIDETVEANSTEVWTVENTMPMPHNFHVHAVQFQVLRVGSAPPPPELAGWKDTIYLEPGVRYELIMQFGPYTDPNSPYMYHCHLLAHEDAGMMGQFVVVKPETQ